MPVIVRFAGKYHNILTLQRCRLIDIFIMSQHFKSLNKENHAGLVDR